MNGTDLYELPVFYLFIFFRVKAVIAALPAAARRNQCAPVTQGLNEIRSKHLINGPWSLVDLLYSQTQ